ncbi:hypothetical protein, conserved [Leishmania tarentolae]|uniref:SET domain-containing protein n=1 Tax=Leishmania tarentolae TaxID=5689 RepID=A0A640KCJ9_LEITA|nr:hypothetical protein, conserved [Leishmania tarentolae]
MQRAAPWARTALDTYVGVHTTAAAAAAAALFLSLAFSLMRNLFRHSIDLPASTLVSPVSSSRVPVQRPHCTSAQAHIERGRAGTAVFLVRPRVSVWGGCSQDHNTAMLRSLRGAENGRSTRCVLTWGHATSTRVILRLSRSAQRVMSTSSCTSTVAAPSSASRRSKRLSYADADKVYGKRSTAAPLWGLRPSLPDGSISTAVSTANGIECHASLRNRVQQRWLTFLLVLMRAPYLGALTMRVLEVAAYAAYVKGSVMVFTRRRAGPPVARATEPDSSGENIDLRDAGCTAGTQMSQASCNADLSKTDDLSASPRLSLAGHPCSTLLSSHDTLLREHALDCLYIGVSPIHSRGLFTARALPRGTRIIAESRRTLLLAPHFVTLLADTHEKLPDTWHYTQPTGCVVELVTQAQPHHLMNHSCAPNVCSGLSRTFWEAARIAGAWQQYQQQKRPLRSHATDGDASECTEAFHGIVREEAIGIDDASCSSVSSLSAQACTAGYGERLTRWPYFADANSFFLTRDVAAGEELTLDYSTRMASLYAGESARALQSHSWLLCRCGQPCCRHYVYRPKPEVIAFLRALRRGLDEQEHGTRAPGQHHIPSVVNNAAPSCRMDVRDPVHIMAKLLELGFDDELMLLSYAATCADVVAYLYGQPLPALQRHSHTSSWAPFARMRAAPVEQERIDVEVRRVSKRQLLSQYRHVFRLLNEAAPVHT